MSPSSWNCTFPARLPKKLPVDWMNRSMLCLLLQTNKQLIVWIGRKNCLGFYSKKSWHSCNRSTAALSKFAKLWSWPCEGNHCILPCCWTCLSFTISKRCRSHSGVLRKVAIFGLIEKLRGSLVSSPLPFSIFLMASCRIFSFTGQWKPAMAV